MLGLFGLLSLGSRSLATEQQGVEVTGHNLANVNNPAYARQRVNISTSITVNGPLGPQGTGADAVAIVQLRSGIIDGQIQSETSVRGSLEAQQSALQFAQSSLGQQISTLSGADATDGVSSSQGLADGLAGLFSGFQSLSTDATSMGERQSLLQKASDLGTQFNQIDQRLGSLTQSLNQSVQDDVTSANSLLGDIAGLNKQISTEEATSQGTANDLRDLRQQKFEELSKFVKVDVASASNGSLHVSVAGTTLVSGDQVVDTMQTYEAGGGQMLVCAMTAGTPLSLTGGSIQGTIEARDGPVATLRASVNSLASQLISEVNTIHAAGFGLNGSSGANFFTGTNAADIKVNDALVSDPSLVQAAGVAGAVGDNQVALALAQLAGKPIPALGGQTLSQSYSQTVSAIGQSFSSVNTQLSNQSVVDKMLQQQRDSVSGVSLDEEMTNLTLYQRAYQASARLITIVDGMLDTIVNMKAP